MKMVVVSGKFDPIDAGHMALLKGASELGNYVIVGLNSDEFVKRSKGFVYQSYDEREKVLRGIKYVNGVNFFDDIDETPVTDLLNKVKYWYPSDKIIYATGCDVGETQDQMLKTLEDTTYRMPKNKPRYLMGVGTPSDIVGAVKNGIDMFDCVMPTRS